MKKIVIALPACGKTTACKYLKHNTDIKSVDYDLRGNKSLLNDEVRDIQTRHAEALFNAGASYIFTHNGAFNYELLDPTKYTIDIYIKECNPREYAHLISDRGDDDAFVHEAFESYDSWVDGMWHLFEHLNDLGFKVTMKILGLNKFILDDLISEIENHKLF